MTFSLKHTKTSGKSDGADTSLIQPSDWNAEHTITAALNKILGTDGGSTSVKELDCTAAGRAILAAADAAAQLAILGGAPGTVPLTSVSTDNTFVLGDANECFYHPSTDTTPRTWTIPANASVAFPIGTVLLFRNGNGAGDLTIAITSDTMRLAGTGTTGSRTLGANGVAAAQKVESTVWQISGTGLT